MLQVIRYFPKRLARPTPSSSRQQRTKFINAISVLVYLVLVPLASSSGQDSAAATSQAISYTFDHLDTIGGRKTTVVGSPRLVKTAGQKFIEFDGQSAIFLDINPLAGLSQFTAEVIFQPTAAGGKEQRFVHFQEENSDNRLLFELRLTDDKRWFLDTFIKSGEGNYTLFANKSTHPIGPWYHAAVVVDGKAMKHFVNGVEELSTPISFTPQKAGKTSLGVRQNRVSWYTGAIRELRITPSALKPADFLKP